MNTKHKHCLCALMCLLACVQREVHNLIAAQRVSACDSRYIQTPDGYLDRWSDKERSTRYAQSLQMCMFFWLVGRQVWPPATVHGPKAKGAPGLD